MEQRSHPPAWLNLIPAAYGRELATALRLQQGKQRLKRLAAHLRRLVEAPALRCVGWKTCGQKGRSHGEVCLRNGVSSICRRGTTIFDGLFPWFSSSCVMMTCQLVGLDVFFQSLGFLRDHDLGDSEDVPVPPSVTCKKTNQSARG